VTTLYRLPLRLTTPLLSIKRMRRTEPVAPGAEKLTAA